MNFSLHGRLYDDTMTTLAQWGDKNHDWDGDNTARNHCMEFGAALRFIILFCRA